MKAWNNIEKMFPNGGISINEGFLTNEEIKNSSLDEIRLNLTTPVKGLVGAEEEIVWKSNGEMSRKVVFSIQPLSNIDNIPLLSTYGQKMINDFLEEKGDN